MSLPRDVACVGLVIDREHVSAVATSIRECKNEDMIKLLSAFRQGESECVVVCGHPSRPGAVGGMARSWKDAHMLFELCVQRMNEAADRSSAFSSAWVLLLSKERQAEVNEWAALSQRTEGNA